MYPTLLQKFTIFLWLLLLGGVVQGKGTLSLHVDPVLWSEIEARLEQVPTPATYDFIPQLVEAHFGNQPDSIYATSYAVMIRLERMFNLEAAIRVGNEMAKVAKERGDTGGEAYAYDNLARYYDALGVYRLAALYTQQAIDLYRELGDARTILSAEYALLKLELHFVSRKKIIPRMKTLLDKAAALKAERLTHKIRLQLMQQHLLVGNYAETEKYLPFLDKLPKSDPIEPEEYPLLINAAKLKGDLALAKNRLNEAEKHFLETLALCRVEPGPWFEIFTLNALAGLELKRGRPSRARPYLDEAQTKAEKLTLHDLLAETFALKARVAEQQGDAAAALRFFKNKNFHEEQFKTRNGGFDLENYYLRAERDKLIADERSRMLALDLKESQLKYSMAVLLLLVLLGVGLVVGYLYQRRRKKELAFKNKQIRDYASQLESLDAAKSRFFANVSHELRTPLSLILGPVSTLLKENQLSERQSALLHAADRSARQLGLMANDILDLRKLESGKVTIDAEPTEVAAFFRLHLEQFTSLAHWKQIKYNYELRIPTGLVAELDREKTRRILYNLLSNALKFTPASGSVIAGVELRESTLSLRVADTGCGIAAEALPQVFDRFYRSNPREQPSVAGVGIGLSICHDYIQLLGGDIRAESQPERGSVFHASWPVALSGQKGQDIAPLSVADKLLGTPVSLPKTTTDGPTLLVVEDDPGLQEYIAMILSEKYRVVCAGHGLAALEKLAAKGPRVDLIVSDLMMPVMDGYQLLERLKSDDSTRHIPVVMLTARADRSDRIQALRIGVDDYLTKPFDEEELLVRIANLLENQAARQQETRAEGQEDNALPRLSETDQAWLEDFEQYVRDNLSSDLLTVASLSDAFAMSESTLLRQLKRLTGLTTLQYLQEMRLGEARLLLERGTCDSVAAVADRVGYRDTRSFSRSFKKRFGKLPSDYA